jgi:hypothetical protein
LATVQVLKLNLEIIGGISSVISIEAVVFEGPDQMGVDDLKFVDDKIIAVILANKSRFTSLERPNINIF